MPPPGAKGLAGAYLAGDRGLLQTTTMPPPRATLARRPKRDPQNIDLLQDTAINAVIAGDFATAVPVAQQLQALGADVQLSGLILIADALGRQDYDGAVAILDGAETEVNPLLGSLLRGWIEAGQGNIDEATATLGGGVGRRRIWRAGQVSSGAHSGACRQFRRRGHDPRRRPGRPRRCASTAPPPASMPRCSCNWTARTTRWRVIEEALAVEPEMELV